MGSVYVRDGHGIVGRGNHAQLGADGQYYGRRNFATIIGIITAVYSMGMLLSPLFLGWMFDQTGSYRTGLIIFLVMYASSSVSSS